MNKYKPTYDRLLNKRGGKVGWGRGRAPGNLRQLMNNLRATRLPPTDDGRFTPIVRTIRHALKDFPDDNTPGWQRGRRKVMLVPTDGMDTATVMPKNHPKGVPDLPALQKVLVDGFQGQNCHVRLVRIAEGVGQSEAEKFTTQFKGVVETRFAPTGRVRTVDEVEQLAPAISDALGVKAP